MNLTKPIISTSLIFLALSFAKAIGQPDSSKALLIKHLSNYLLKAYVSEEIAKKMGDTISYKWRNGLYDSSLNMDEFAYEVNLDLRRVSNDRHIAIWPALDPSDHLDKIKKQLEFDKHHKSWAQRRRAARRSYERLIKITSKDMFVYGDIKMMPGGVGYLEIKEFDHLNFDSKKNKGRISLAAAMQFLEGAGSLIIDLRNHGAGSLHQCVMFCSYFAPSPKTYFTTMQSFTYWYSRKEREPWTDTLFTSSTIYKRVPASKKIFILVSNNTFSAAEYAAYTIKRFMPHAVIIGEPTPGGGNSHSGIRHEKYFSAVIPHTRHYDETNSNFDLEGHGVTPGIIAPPDSAYAIACRLSQIKNGEAAYFHKDKPVKKTALPSNYQDYIGNYHRANIIAEEGSLYLVYSESRKIPLEQKLQDVFSSHAYESIRFTRDRG